MDIILESINLGHIRTRPSKYVLSNEYNIDDLFTALSINCHKKRDNIMTNMIDNDYIGMKLDYIPHSCITDFLNCTVF